MTTEVQLRSVLATDLPVLFAQQLDPEAVRMAGFPSRGLDAFMAHWTKLLTEPRGAITRTIVFQGKVAGHMGCWEQGGGRHLGYWLGREFWGRGIATAALGLLLQEVTVRPLQAHVVKHNLASIRVLQKCGFTLTGEEKFTTAGGTTVEELILSLP